MTDHGYLQVAQRLSREMAAWCVHRDGFRQWSAGIPSLETAQTG